MAYTMDQIYVNSYNAMLHHMASSPGGQLRGLFPTEHSKGEYHNFERMSPGFVKPFGGRMTPILPDDNQFSRRRASITGSVYKSFIYDAEKMNMLVDPTSALVQDHLKAHGRNFDIKLFQAMVGDAFGGKDGNTVVPFDPNQIVAAGGTGLTTDKLLDAIAVLENANVDTEYENIYLFITPSGKNTLLKDQKFVDSDYQEVKALSGKMMPTFRGIAQIKTTTNMPQPTGGEKRALLVAESALAVAYGLDPKVDISQRKDYENLPWQIYSEEFFGAVRMEEARIVDIRFV